jgi:hypothetical protein
LTVAVLGERKYALASCLFWFTLNVLLELGQHSYFVRWLDLNNIGLAQVLNTYFRFGTFDALDIVMTIAGAGVAYFLVQKGSRPTILEDGR